MTDAVKLPARTLYVVATPIGNLEDITLRALRILKEVNLIACEDTRQTQKLLNHYNIPTRTISYHEHNEMTRASELVQQMQEGASVALVTDAGMPGISDPGFRLISLAIRNQLAVVPIPGASAFLSASADSSPPSAESAARNLMRSSYRRTRRSSTKLPTAWSRHWKIS
jgi:16S rRNA (cytidine1402-2'-O)-methyltransferase